VPVAAVAVVEPAFVEAAGDTLVAAVVGEVPAVAVEEAEVTQVPAALVEEVELHTLLVVVGECLREAAAGEVAEALAADVVGGVVLRHKGSDFRRGPFAERGGLSE